MERRRLLKSAGILATGGVTSLAGCSSSENGDSGGEPKATDTEETAGGSGEETTGGSGGSNTVMMVTEGSEYYFDPIGLFVESGDTVTFEIQSGSHSATAYKEGTSSASVTRIPIRL